MGSADDDADHSDDWQAGEDDEGEGEAVPQEKLAHQDHPSSWQQPLTQENIDAVQTAMQGFSLPPEATPSWAKEVSEEQWIEALRAGMTDIGWQAGMKKS